MPNKGDLSLFFEPKGVADIGSLREGYFGGYVVIKTLLNAGFICDPQERGEHDGEAFDLRPRKEGREIHPY